LLKIKESLEELNPDVEKFSWGPSYAFAKDRQKEALLIVENELRRK
jgi:hypothetical protein